MSEFNFTAEEFPKAERSTKPNPFTEVVGTLITDSGKGVGFDVAEGASLSTVRSQLDRAGLAQDPPVSVHWRVTPKNAKTGPARVNIRTSAKITQRKADAIAADAEAQVTK